MPPKKLSPETRHQRILARLETDGSVRIAHLADEFGVATETIRRDLDQLYHQGLINRTYGGAARKPFTDEPDIDERGRRHVAERDQIAGYAASLIETGDAVMIDCGSTTLSFARSLAATPVTLTVVTNCLPVAYQLASLADSRILVAPGEYSAHEKAVHGHETVEFLKRFRVNRAVIGAGGLTCDGPTDADSRGCWIKRAMIEQAEEVILLLDSSKFGVVQFETVCTLDQVTHLVTDAMPGPSLLQCLERAGVEIHVTRSKAPLG